MNECCNAVLQAERERLLALTPPEVVEAAAKAILAADYADFDRPPKWEDFDQSRRISAVRAALPVLLAPEVARREQAEVDLALHRSIRAAQGDSILKLHHELTAAEAEVARLRGALEKLGSAPCLGTDENNDTCGVTFTCGACRQNAEARAALEAK